MKTQINTLFDLRDVARSKKSVIVPSNYIWSRPKPASWVLNLQGALIAHLIEQGMFLYEKEDKE